MELEESSIDSGAYEVSGSDGEEVEEISETPATTSIVKKSGRMTWSREETHTLLQIFCEEKRKIKETTDKNHPRDSTFNFKLTQMFNEAALGEMKTIDQIKKKISNLKNDLKDLNRKHGNSGSSPCDDDERYELLKMAFGNTALHNPGKSDDSHLSSMMQAGNGAEEDVELEGPPESPGSTRSSGACDDSPFLIKNSRRRKAPQFNLQSKLAEASLRSLQIQEKFLELEMSRKEANEKTKDAFQAYLLSVNQMMKEEAVFKKRRMTVHLKNQIMEKEERTLRIFMMKKKMEKLGYFLPQPSLKAIAYHETESTQNEEFSLEEIEDEEIEDEENEDEEIFHFRRL